MCTCKTSLLMHLISIPLLSADGPSAVLLNSNREATENESEMLRFTCTAIDVYPSAVFTWSINCHTQTNTINSSTCVFNLTKQHEELPVTCTASNAYYQTALHSQTVNLPFKSKYTKIFLYKTPCRDTSLSLGKKRLKNNKIYDGGWCCLRSGKYFQYKHREKKPISFTLNYLQQIENDVLCVSVWNSYLI